MNNYIKIRLNEFIENIEKMYGDICKREIIHKIFLEQIKPKKLDNKIKGDTIICVDMSGIKSMTVSVIIEFFLKDLNGYCRKFENVVVMVDGIEEEVRTEMMMDFEASVLLGAKNIKDDTSIIPYMLVRYMDKNEEKISVLGFANDEAQSQLFCDLYKNKKRITSSELAEREQISLATASNRLIRLYEKRLVCRKVVGPRQYQYYCIYWHNQIP